MFKGLAHIGIAVKDLERSAQLFSKLLGVSPYHEELVPDQGVRALSFRIGEAALELLESRRDDSAIARFIEKRGEGVHHLSFIVEDLQKEIKRLRELGFEIVDSHPRPGAGGYRVAFLHPRSTNGVLIEISEQTGHLSPE